jgi:ethanolamine utilization protein EutP (predicted NTPase)
MNIKKVGKILGGVTIGVAAVAAAPFTGGGSLLAGAAALGLGTTAAVVGAVVAGAAGGSIINFFINDDKVNKLGIIGMKSSGKTTLLNNLRGIVSIPKTTFRESYDSFEFKLSNKKTIHIVKGNDISGSKNYLTEYREIIKNNDVILYFFNVCEYLTNLEYKRDCNSRLDHINVDIENKKIAIIASHSDLSQHSKNILTAEVLSQVGDKKYSKLFNNGFFVVNLKDDKEIKELIDKIFS